MTLFKKVHHWFNSEWFTSDRKMVMASRFSRDGVDLHDVSRITYRQRSVSGTVPSLNINSFLAERFYRM